jgi:hypothetical protein
MGTERRKVVIGQISMKGETGGRMVRIKEEGYGGSGHVRGRWDWD